ncbi:Peptide hydrolase, partial [Tolypocladium capitatum]
PPEPLTPHNPRFLSQAAIARCPELHLCPLHWPSILSPCKPSCRFATRSVGSTRPPSMGCHPLFAFRPGPVTFWTTVLYLAIAIPIIYIHETVPSAPADLSLSRGLNLTEAWLDLQNITNAYHPYNSRQNDRVRQYFIDRSKEVLNRNGVNYTAETPRGIAWQNLSADSVTHGDTADNSGSGTRPPRATLFDDQTSNFTRIYDAGAGLSGDIRASTWTGQYFEGNNYYIYIHGKEDPEGDWWLSDTVYNGSRANRGVLVNCHFDSVATSYGATDDGVACVTMLQLLSYFTAKGHQPDNGIILLFNNAEEDGLLGARAFGQSPLLQFCHTFANLEGVGAGGRAMLFRTTDLQMAQAYSGSPHPFGSIVAADAFERGAIMSGTDYEIFADIYGQRGVDIAFYTPRSRYHTREDDARHTSIHSIWHMLSAALATTKKLSRTTSTIFNSDQSGGRKDSVQNSRMIEGVWFDWLGIAWTAFPLSGLFAWSLTLLITTPLVLFIIIWLLIRKDKCYFFARVRGWTGFFRFPLALTFAGALTMGSIFILAKFNPLIVYSSGYAVWAMALSSSYFTFWLIMRGSSPTRLSVNVWLFGLIWVIQVLATAAEDRHIGAFYFAAFFHSAVFLSLLLSLLEQFALPRKHGFTQGPDDVHQARDLAHRNDTGRGGEDAHSNVDDDVSHGAGTPAQTTLLGTGENGHGSNGQTIFASIHRLLDSLDPSFTATARRPPPLHEDERLWSSRLPTWTWFIQLLLLAPVHLILVGSQGLVDISAIAMTGTDGSSLLAPVLVLGLLSIILLLPLTPFMHRITHHIPTILCLVFIGTFFYNLAAFPFSDNYRFKFIFQQVVDLDKRTDIVTLSGIEEFLRPVIGSLPDAAGQRIKCSPTVGRDLMDCQYDASSHHPNLASGTDLDNLITVRASESSDGMTADIQVDAIETRTCYLDLSRPIFNFSIEGERGQGPRVGSIPPGGLQHIQLWRRKWGGSWNLTLQLTEDGRSMAEGPGTGDTIDSVGDGELKMRSEASELQTTVGPLAKPMEVTVRCAWSDANNPGTIPAFHRLQKYMPTWAIVTKRGFSLVEVRKTYKVAG